MHVEDMSIYISGQDSLNASRVQDVYIAVFPLRLNTGAFPL